MASQQLSNIQTSANNRINFTRHLNNGSFNHWTDDHRSQDLTTGMPTVNIFCFKISVLGFHLNSMQKDRCSDSRQQAALKPIRDRGQGLAIT